MPQPHPAKSLIHFIQVFPIVWGVLDRTAVLSQAAAVLFPLRMSGLKLILQEEWWCKEREASIVIKLMSILVKAADLKPLIGSISDRDLLEFWVGVYLAALEPFCGFCQVTPGVITARLALFTLCLTRLTCPEPDRWPPRQDSWDSRSTYQW